MFRRRRRPELEPTPAPAAANDPAQALGALRALVAEGIIWQDEAAALMLRVRNHEPLSELAPLGGPLVDRFTALRERLPRSSDATVQRHTTVLVKVFDHHALLLSASLDLLAADWRSERMSEELGRLDGLGAPANWLEAIWEELSSAGPETGPRAPAEHPPAPPGS
jgi:hypothetical protein